jgi:hypothetical protein
VLVVSSPLLEAAEPLSGQQLAMARLRKMQNVLALRRKAKAARMLMLLSLVILGAAIIAILALAIALPFGLDRDAAVEVWRRAVIATLVAFGMFVAALRPPPPKPQIGPRMWPHSNAQENQSSRSNRRGNQR